MSNLLNEILEGVKNRYGQCDSYQDRGTLRFSLYQKEVSDTPALDQEVLVETFFKRPSSFKSTWHSGSQAQQKTSGKLWADGHSAKLYSLVENPGNHLSSDNERTSENSATGSEISFRSLSELLASDQLGTVNLPAFMPLLLTQPELINELLQPGWLVGDKCRQTNPKIEIDAGACWIISQETLPTTRSYWINKEDYRVEAMLYDFRARFWESDLLNRMIGTLSQATGAILRKPEWTLAGKSMGHRMFTQLYRIEEAHFDEPINAALFDY